MSVVSNRVCNIISRIFIDVIRGVPMIVLAYFVYFGVPFACNNILGIRFTLTALQAGTVCLALNCGAYMAEIIRAGIQSVDKGQMEAARSLGLSYWRSMYRHCIATGNSYNDSQYYQPVYHYVKRYLNFVYYRVFPSWSTLQKTW